MVTENDASARSLLESVQGNQVALSELMTTILSPLAGAALPQGAPPFAVQVDVASAVADASATLRSLDAQLPRLRATT